MDSILQTIKKLLGVPLEQTHFDTDIIIHINSTFSVLKDLGVGPMEGFRILDDLAVWEEFISEYDPNFSSIQDYIYYRVKLRFDPPASSTHLQALKDAIAEAEWRLNNRAEHEQTTEEEQWN